MPREADHAKTCGVTNAQPLTIEEVESYMTELETSDECVVAPCPICRVLVTKYRYQCIHITCNTCVQHSEYCGVCGQAWMNHVCPVMNTGVYMNSNNVAVRESILGCYEVVIAEQQQLLQ